MTACFDPCVTKISLKLENNSFVSFVEYEAPIQ